MRITGKPQVFCVALGMILCVVCVGPVGADRVVCPVEADTYVLHGSMTSNGYPTANALRAWNWVAAEAFVRFDLAGVQDWNSDGLVNGDDIVDATFRFYTHDCTGMMCQPMAPAGTTQTANVLPVAVWTDPENHGDNAFWSESTWEDEGCVDGLNDPGNVPGVDPAVYSYDQGPGHWGEGDVTAMVKAWLNDDYPNNGLRLVGNDDYGWSWSSKDWDGDDAGGGGDPDLAHCLQVERARCPGDANDDGKVDGGDLALWQQNYDPLGENENNTFEMGDFNDDGKIDGGDLAIWQQNYDPLGTSGAGGMTAVPEPATCGLLALGSLLGVWTHRKRRQPVGTIRGAGPSPSPRIASIEVTNR